MGTVIIEKQEEIKNLNAKIANLELTNERNKKMLEDYSKIMDS
jgi:hypothetical protein